MNGGRQTFKDILKSQQIIFLHCAESILFFFHSFVFCLSLHCERNPNVDIIIVYG